MSMKLGNGVTETRSYNSRLQPTQIQAGSLLTLTYGYSANQNNGNVQSQIITRPVGTWTQSYGYDAANRLTCSNEVASEPALACGTGTPVWYQANGYDERGNRWVAASSGLPPLTNEVPQSGSW